MNQQRVRRTGMLSLLALATVAVSGMYLSKNSPAADEPVHADFSDFQKTVQPFFTQHCITCHGDMEPEANLSFTHFGDAASLEKQSANLAKVARVLRLHTMPPKGEVQPKPEEVVPVAKWLEAYNLKVAMAGPRTPGHVTLRRLNRSEYNNTIRDLLGVDYKPADAFPVDDAGYGFDNNGDVLSMAPMLMDKYLASAVAVLDRAIMVEPVSPPPTKTWEAATLPGTIPTSDPKANSGGTGFGANMTNGRVFNIGGEIFTDYDFPETGSYVLRVRGYGNTGTVNRQSPIVVFKIDGEQVDKPITIKNDQRGTLVYPTQKIKLEAGKHRVTLAFTNGPTAEEAAVAATQPATPATAPAGNGRRGGNNNNNGAAGAGGRGVGVAATATAPAGVAVATAPATQASRMTLATQPATTTRATQVAVATAPATATAPAGAATRPAGVAAAGRGAGFGRGRGTGPQASPTGKPNLGVVFIEVEGPQEITMSRIDRMPESYKKIFVTLPSATVSKEEAARKIISNFATRAFRRPLEAGELERMMAFWTQVDKGGVTFDRGIDLALQPILASPKFLYRIETGPTAADKDGIRTLNEFELASRLSYFLWSSMPDDELFGLAKQGKLRANLQQQVKRMIADPKSVALVEDFAGQWLQLRKMVEIAPDPKKYPSFNDELRNAMIKETQLFLTTIMREDRSVLEFIDADFTFMNGVLAKHYGRTDVKGEAFQRVSLKGGERGGLLTQASILTITSYPHRTSPVIRGKWVLENLLDSAPPPPPPDVPKLDEGEKIDLSGTLRQRMEQHRSNPNCISCHTLMDPIGFGLENFDGIGAWRERDTNNEVIDASGTLPGGQNFRGARELREILKAQKDQFSLCLCNRMLTYALGRGVEPSDLALVNQIAAGLKAKEYKFSALIEQIVLSDAFQKQGTKRGEQ